MRWPLEPSVGVTRMDSWTFRIIVGTALIVGGLYIAGVFDEVLYEYGFNFHSCTEYTGGKVVCASGVGKSSPSAENSQAAPQQELNAYPPSVVQNFTDACMSTGGGQAYCSCTIEEIQGRYTLDEFSVLETEYLNTGQMPEELAGVMANCVQAQATSDTPTTTVQDSQCSQLMLGCDAVVTNTGTWLNVRDAPTINGAIVGRLEDGMTVLIVGDRVKSDGYRWWQIESAGPAGWAAEGDKDGTAWLIPSIGSSDAQGSVSDDPSLADTANEPSYCQELAETRAELEADSLWEYVKSQLEFSPNGPFLKECIAWGD